MSLTTKAVWIQFKLKWGTDNKSLLPGLVCRSGLLPRCFAVMFFGVFFCNAPKVGVFLLRITSVPSSLAAQNQLFCLLCFLLILFCSFLIKNNYHVTT